VCIRHRTRSSSPNSDHAAKRARESDSTCNARDFFIFFDRRKQLKTPVFFDVFGPAVAENAE